MVARGLGSRTHPAFRCGSSCPSRVARAFRKCCRADQFRFRPLCCARIRDAHSCRGGVHEDGFVSHRAKAKGKGCAAWKENSGLRCFGKKRRGFRRRPALGACPALSAGLLMGFSRTLWSYATIAEVYTLDTLLICVIFFLMLRWGGASSQIEGVLPRPGRIGMAHPQTPRTTFIFTPLPCLRPRARDTSCQRGADASGFGCHRLQNGGAKNLYEQTMVYAALISVPALVAIYAYLPFAAAHTPVINWGTPRSLQKSGGTSPAVSIGCSFPLRRK